MVQGGGGRLQSDRRRGVPEHGALRRRRLRRQPVHIDQAGRRALGVVTGDYRSGDLPQQDLLPVRVAVRGHRRQRRDLDLDRSDRGRLGVDPRRCRRHHQRVGGLVRLGVVVRGGRRRWRDPDLDRPDRGCIGVDPRRCRREHLDLGRIVPVGVTLRGRRPGGQRAELDRSHRRGGRLAGRRGGPGWDRGDLVCRHRGLRGRKRDRPAAELIEPERRPDQLERDRQRPRSLDGGPHLYGGEWSRRKLALCGHRQRRQRSDDVQPGGGQPDVVDHRRQWRQCHLGRVLPGDHLLCGRRCDRLHPVGDRDLRPPSPPSRRTRARPRGGPR